MVRPERLTIERLNAMDEQERGLVLAKRDGLVKAQPGDVPGKMGSYISEHPTNFNWTDPTRRLVKKIEAEWPWKTYINTYYWHPPYDYPSITKRYDWYSFDVWGGGLSNGEYTGYRGKALPDSLHEDIFNYVFYEQGLAINWVCTNGWLWTYYGGWERYNPYDPYGADMGHFKHLHFTMRA